MPSLRYVIDSDILIHLERGHPAVIEQFEAIPIEAMATTIMNRAELLVGAFYRRYSEKRMEQLDKMLSLLTLLPFDEQAAARFARTKSNLIKNGKSVADADVIIASIALTHNLTLVTNNVRDFCHIPELALQTWHHRH